MTKLTYPFTPMPLRYRFNELEPYLSEEVVSTHYEKHYKSYINKLNETLNTFPRYHHWTLYDLILNIYQLPLEIQNQVWVNAGGVYNHELYFATMTPYNQQIKDNLLHKALNNYFGSMEGFEELFKRLTPEFVGSGYVTLVASPFGELRLMTTINQNTPLPYRLFPLLTIDLWEHSYYLQYQNNRKEYVNAWFNLINWEEVSKRYQYLFFRNVNCLKQ